MTRQDALGKYIYTAEFTNGRGFTFFNDSLAMAREHIEHVLADPHQSRFAGYRLHRVRRATPAEAVDVANFDTFVVER